MKNQELSELRSRKHELVKQLLARKGGKKDHLLPQEKQKLLLEPKSMRTRLDETTD